MIPRYARPEMQELWEPAHRLRLWFLIEAHAGDKMAELGMIPAESAKVIWEKGDIPYTPERIARIAAIEAETKHDVIAFLTELAEQIGPDARFLHQGLTSSDILDSAFALQLTEASDLILSALERLLIALRKRALEHKRTPSMGRSHGIHAEPLSFGLKLLSHYVAFQRAFRRMHSARAEVATLALSGAVGTFANIPPEVEAYVAKKLRLKVEPVSTQIIPRDRHAAFFATLGVIASQIEHLSIEIRHLQRSELGEAEEFFSAGQKGSSAMPHKRNPVLSENLTGLARLVRSSVTPALENVALWHERDISHSSVERGIGPDATTHLHFALHRLAGVIENLIVYPDAMQRNLDQQSGLYNSQRILLALTQAGASREAAYRLVQKVAMECWKNKLDFSKALKQDKGIAEYLSEKDIDECCDIAFHLRRIDHIFDRVLKSTPK